MISHPGDPRAQGVGPAWLLAIAFAFVSCSDTASPTAPGQQSPPPAAARTVVLAVGQSAVVGPATVLRVDQVVGDSRCPSDVTCVWAGEVTIALSLEAGSDSQAFRLSDSAKSATVRGLRFTLLKVEPYPRSDASIPLAAYRISIEVAGS